MHTINLSTPSPGPCRYGSGDPSASMRRRFTRERSILHSTYLNNSSLLFLLRSGSKHSKVLRIGYLRFTVRRKCLAFLQMGQNIFTLLVIHHHIAAIVAYGLFKLPGILFCSENSPNKGNGPARALFTKVIREHSLA
jgi:hypothetical protein